MSKKQARLLRNITSAGGQTVVQTAALFFLYRFLIDEIGIERLGIWSIILATASAARVSELGLGGSVTKFVASYRAQQDLLAVGEVLQTAAITIAFVLAVVLSLAYPALIWLLPEVLPQNALDEGRLILPYALVSLWFNAVASIWMSGLDGCLRSDLRAGLSIFATVAFLLMAWVGVSARGLVGLAAAQVAQAVLLTVLGWVAVRRVVTAMPLIPSRWTVGRLRNMLGYGVNFQINSFVMLLFEPTAKVLLGRYGDLSAAGYFELAQRLVMKVRAFIVESNRVVVPVFAAKADVVYDTRNLYRRNAQYLFFVVTPLFSVLVALMPAISELWIGTYERQFVFIGIVLSAAWCFNAMSAPAYFAFLGHGRLKWLTASHLAMGACNALLGIVFGMMFGWQGVIAAFVISLLLGSSITIGAYHRQGRFAIREVLSAHDFWLAFSCFTAAAVMLTVYLSTRHIETNLWVRVCLVLVGMSMAASIAVSRHPIWIQILGAAGERLRSRRSKQ